MAPPYRITATNKDTKVTTKVGTVWENSGRLSLSWSKVENQWETPIFKELADSFWFNIDIKAGTLTQVLIANRQQKAIVATITPSEFGFRVTPVAPVSGEKPNRLFALASNFYINMQKNLTAEEHAAKKETQDVNTFPQSPEVPADIQF
jgi:hypothetical protein